MNPEQENEREDEWDEEPEYAPRSIFAAGWFRAVLVLTVLAIVVVVALPYLLNWLEPAPAGPKVSPSKQATGLTATADSAGSPPAAAAPVAPAPRAAVPPVAPERPRTTSAASSTGPSRAERVATMPARPAIAREPSEGRYWVQLGLFKEAANAEHLARKLREQGLSVEVARVARPGAGSVPAGTYHLVRAGAYGNQSRALAARDELRKKGYAGFLTEGAAQ